MRRADRLFRLIQYLRARSRAATAADIAQTLEVSVRTIYRDVADLIGSGVPIDGEPGVGYLLRGGYDLPPLMFDVEEIEALVLGAEIVSRWSDPELAAAARRALDKITAALPERLRAELLNTALFAPPSRNRIAFSADLGALRRAVRQRNKVKFSYVNQQELSSTRIVWPLGLAFYGPVWVLMSWCELRRDFRTFRIDRMTQAQILSDGFIHEPGKTIGDYLKRKGVEPSDLRPRW
ncbi:MAG: helix-turn-helix transcriptional regulator [Alphaproteobacteria bacterium]